MRNRVHPSKVVFQKSRVIASDFFGIQTHAGERRSAQAPMIDSISSTMFFSCDNFTKTSEITPKLLEITVIGLKLQLSVEEKVKISLHLTMTKPKTCTACVKISQMCSIHIHCDWTLHNSIIQPLLVSHMDLWHFKTVIYHTEWQDTCWEWVWWQVLL